MTGREVAALRDITTLLFLQKSANGLFECIDHTVKPSHYVMVWGLMHYSRLSVHSMILEGIVNASKNKVIILEGMKINDGKVND